MFEKEAEEIMMQKVIKENDCIMTPCKTLEDCQLYDFCFDDMVDAFKDGAEFGYNKANEWHYVKDGDLPKDTTSLYLVRVYSWNFSFSHLYKKYTTYIPTVCEWNGEYFTALDNMAYSNARNINSCVAWKEIVLPKESE